MEKIPSYKEVDKARKARQKDRFLFFDLGVRNVVLNLHRSVLSKEESGALFEQFIILQCLSFKYSYNKNWQIKSYSDATTVDIDLIIETDNKLIAVEVKWATAVNAKMLKSLNAFANLVQRPVTNYLVYRGRERQRFGDTLALPFQDFLNEVIPNLA